MKNWKILRWFVCMGQECKTVGIVGAGASGCITAYFLSRAGIDVTLFDYSSPLRTLLPTGGGRCNLAHAEYDFRELAKNYPRGEKFLYSVFSNFSTYDTLALFDELGIQTYTQNDGRIFPVSNSSKDVRNIILSKLKNVKIKKEKVTEIQKIENGFKINTSNNSSYFFSHVVVASGGKNSTEFIKHVKHTVITHRPALVGLNTQENLPSGIVINNVFSKDLKISGDILLTHFGISGPLIYKISSLKAFDAFPYKLGFDLYAENLPLQELLNKNPHKELKNILSKFLPSNFIKFLIPDLSDVCGYKIDGAARDKILDKIHNFEVIVKGTNKGEETVTAGGIDLNEIHSKSMESKLCPHLYFTGEVLNIDGFCGGFNLQNAWSTAYVAAQAILN